MSHSVQLKLKKKKKTNKNRKVGVYVSRQEQTKYERKKSIFLHVPFTLNLMDFFF